MKRTLLNSIILAIGISVLSFWGCEDIDPDAVSPEDSTAAAEAVGQAHDALEGLMTVMMEAEPDSVEEMLNILDFSEAYDLYVSAHELDPRNNAANFGMAFTGFLMVSQDAALQEMLLRWEAYFKANEPFAVAGGNTLGRKSFGYPLSVGALSGPLAYTIETPLALSKMSLDDVPQFSEFQTLIESTILPVVASSLTALEAIDDDSSFIFMVSPAMQGDPEADPIELDLTEVYVLEGGLQALKSFLKTVVAYNFDFISYDSLGIVTELSQGSDFATLKPDGANALAAAHAAALLAVDKMFAALDFLESETDPQDDDLIRFEENDDPDKVREILGDIQEALNGPSLIHYEYTNDLYDDNGFWFGEEVIEDSILVDVSQFFLNPIEDFKAMLPPYTMGTEMDYGYEAFNLTEHVNIEEDSVTISGLDNAYISVSFSYSAYDSLPEINVLVNLGFFQYDLMNTPQEDLPAAVWELYSEFQALIDQYSSELYHYPSIYFFWSGNITSGSSFVIDGDIFVAYEELMSIHVVPLPSWTATSYSEWLQAWPDPTMQGIFPDMTAEGLVEFLGINADNWNDF